MPHPVTPVCLFAASVCGLLLQASSAREPTSPISVTQAISNLRQAATVYDEPAMEAAVERLVRFGPTAVPQVRQLARHEDANVRWKAIQTLGFIGLAESPLCRELLTASRDPDADVRGAAIDVLAQLFPKRAETHKATEHLLADPHPLVRVRAAAAQWTTRRDLRAIATLAQALQHSDWMAAAEASRRLATVGEPATPALAELLQSRAPRTQRAALLTLAQFTELPPDMLITILPLADSDDPLLFPAALQTLLACGTVGHHQLVARCTHAAAPHRAAALQVLSAATTSTPTFRRLLLKSLNDPAAPCQLAAMAVIAHHRISATELQQPLLRHLHHPTADHRGAAIAALTALGESARLALPRLRQMAGSEPVDYIRRAAQRLVDALDTRTTDHED
ncbi:MAG: HEAT repeat domain-containing protein [Planctomycetota bacterium]|nr:HEAT repeat domain-containing protein [Planctomycetota bacterium]